MGRVLFELNVSVLELINLPMFDGTKCMIVFTISNDKITNNFKKLHTTSHTSTIAEVKSHKVKFGDAGKYSTEFKVHTMSNGQGNPHKTEVLADKWLTISFIIKRENHQELLGVVTVNLTDLVNERARKEMRVLLDKSKTNSIAKMNIFIRHLSQDGDVQYTSKSATNAPETKTRSASASTSTSASAGSSPVSPSFKLSNNVLKPRSSLSLRRTSSNSMREDLSFSKLRTTSSTIKNGKIPSPKASHKDLSLAESMERKGSRLVQILEPGHRQGTEHGDEHGHDHEHHQVHTQLDTQALMNKACEVAINDTTLLDELTNKTYRFTWQLRTVAYEEFTPAECVKDIVERNGNGWRKNDEGVDMVDVVENDFRESYLSRRHYNYYNHRDGVVNHDGEDEDEIPDVFEDFKNMGEGDGDDGDEDDDALGRKIYRVNSSGGDNSSESEEDDGDDEGDVFYSYYKNRKRNVKKVKKFKPLTEAEVREDLRSWHIAVKP